MKPIKFAVPVIFAVLLFGAATYASPAEDSYAGARKCYDELSHDLSARNLREPWEKCIKMFENVVKDHRKHVKGVDAKYSLGRLYEELAFYSKNQADWTRAVDEYESFARQFPRNSMADDAYYRSACIKWERLKDKEGAKKDLLAIVRHYKKSDHFGEARRYLKDMEANLVPGVTVPKDEPALPARKEAALSEKRFIIVIDPGHGGDDTGAVGPGGTLEKDVTLDIAKKLSADIKNDIKGATVSLTRDTDKTLTLGERVRFANKKRADYFISIHANASRSKEERGIQTYYLNNASDRAAEKLAMQENKDSGRPASDLDRIISTMIQNASTEESRELAGSIHKSVVGNLSKKYSSINDEKVRSALFYVLVGVKCPSVLVEVSYLSNPSEEKRLKSDKYQNDIASHVTGGLKNHIKAQAISLAKSI